MIHRVVFKSTGRLDVRRIRPAIAVTLVVVVLFGAAGALALIARLFQRMGSDSATPVNAGFFLLLVALGVAVASAATVALNYWHHRRQKR